MKIKFVNRKWTALAGLAIGVAVAVAGIEAVAVAVALATVEGVIITSAWAAKAAQQKGQ